MQGALKPDPDADAGELQGPQGSGSHFRSTRRQAWQQRQERVQREPNFQARTLRHGSRGTTRKL